jgi:ABC-type uncharacterized transport system involved in gliding motility auxiliary subunit
MLNRITGIIGWIGTALIFAAVAIKFLRPNWPPEYQTYTTWVGLLFILIYFAGQWREIATFYGKRQARYGTMMAIAVLVGLGILIAVNYLGTRQSKRWDFTENQAYSLSDQSKRILDGLDAPVTFTVYDQATNFDQTRERLEPFDYESDDVKVEFVDMDRDPARAKAAEVSAYGTILIEHKGRLQRVSSTEEQAITNALIKVVSGPEKKVFFTQGHGERDTAGSDRLGYASITTSLTRDNFAVDKVVIAQQKEIPAEASVVVIAGPQTDFLQPEIDALNRYVAKGGKVLFLLDPPDDMKTDLPNIRAFLKQWAIDFGNDIVVDASGTGQLFGGDASVPVAAIYPAHPITEGFRVMTAFPLARSIAPIEGGAAGRTAQPLVQTGERSWAETDLKGLAAGVRPEFSAEGGDKQGPVTLGAAVTAPATDVQPPLPAGNTTPAAPVEAPKPETRIIAVGDSDFAANNALGIQGNEDFFLNMVSWLAQQEDLIAIRPREAQDRRITLTADQQQRVALLSLLIIPGLVFAGGFYVWWRRR